MSRSLRDWGLVAAGSLLLVTCHRKTVDPELGIQGGIEMIRLPPADASTDAAADAAGDGSVEPAWLHGAVPEDRVKGVKAIIPHPQHRHAKKNSK